MTATTVTMKSFTTTSSVSSCQRASALIPYPVVYNNDNPQQTNKTAAKRRMHQSTSPTTTSSSILSRTIHSQTQQRTCQPLLIATISAGFDKGDYLIREERGQNVYFDFFEEAYNYASTKGFARMSKHEEDEYMSIVRRAHKSVPGGIRYNTGRLLMVLCKKLVPLKPVIVEEEEEEPNYGDVVEEGSYTKSSSSVDEHVANTKKENRRRQKLKQSTNTLPTDSESDSCTSRSFHSSTRASSARQSSFSTSTSYVDSWE